MRGSLRIGRIAGIPVGVHWSLAVVAALLTTELATGPLRSTVGGDGTALALASAMAVAFFASILAHELGHALVARRHGVGTEGIDLWAMGGVARLSKEPPTPRAAWRIAVAGPAVSAVLVALFAVLAVVLSGPAAVALAWLAVVNAVVTVVNLVPVAPLDGGRILTALVWWRSGDRTRGQLVAARAGRAFGWVLIGFGTMVTLMGGFGLFVALLGAFLLLSARAEEASAYVSQAFDGVRVREVTWFGIATATADVDVELMLLQRDRLGAVDVVAVVDRLGFVTGIVTGAQLEAGATERRARTRLGELALPITLTARATPDEPLTDAMGRINPIAPFLTVWDGDRLVGIVRNEAVRDRLRDVPALAGRR
jgi:Zn-dependent protease